MPQDVPPSPRGGEPKARYRIRFRKGGDVRFVSHRDLLRTLERSARRAELPLAWTRGFNPRPRISVAQALPLGVEGLVEVVEVVLTEPLPVADLLARWGAQMPPGLSLGEGRELPLGARPAQAARVRYEVVLADPPPDLADRVAALLAAPSAPVERRERPGKQPSRPLDV
ncbi:MAG: TIGR03936 family radical SAM-associated protein, partial [Planctomycetales bacterium]|nr:TIGR03936 family radical SAM-associated protein [Planctomycetales bacterium]